MDNFGVKYVGEKHALHLKQTLKENYTFTTEWDGTIYTGIRPDWYYEQRKMHISLPGNTKKSLKQFSHKRKKKKQPYPRVSINYGDKKQYATQPSSAPLIDKKGKKCIQQVCGFIFLGKPVDSTLLYPISAIASQSTNPTEETMKQKQQLLDYIVNKEDAIITYRRSDMKLAVHRDASYLSEPKARSRSGGHFFLSNEATIPQNNGAILNIDHIIKHVMTSATEAEIAALYIMAHDSV